MKVIVLGGGLAGLAAAVELRTRGAEVEVWDPGPPGGRAQTMSPQPGWIVERGPHTFTGRAEPIFAFAERLGLADKIVKLPSGARYVVRDGKLKKAPRPLLSFRELFRLARGVFRTASLSDGMTIHHFLRDNFGPELAEGPAGAASVGIWACRNDEVELAAGFPALAAGLARHGSLFRMMRASKGGRSGTFGFEGGMGVLSAAAATKAGTIRHRAANEVLRAPQGWLVDGERADAVIVATDTPEAGALLDPVAPGVGKALGDVRYSPILVAHWLSPDVDLPHGFGWLAPPSEKRPLLGTIFSSDLHPTRAPAGQRGFSTMIGGTLRPEAVAMDRQAVEGVIKAEVEALGSRPFTISGLEIIRHPRAVAIPEPGHLARVAQAHAALPAGLALAGAWCGGGAMPDAITSGLDAARKVMPDVA